MNIDQSNGYYYTSFAQQISLEQISLVVSVIYYLIGIYTQAAYIIILDEVPPKPQAKESSDHVSTSSHCSTCLIDH